MVEIFPLGEIGIVLLLAGAGIVAVLASTTVIYLVMTLAVMQHKGAECASRS